MSETLTEKEAKSYTDRLAICRVCPERKGRLMAVSRCNLCGCVLAAKAALPASRCPAKKW